MTNASMTIVIVGEPWPSSVLLERIQVQREAIDSDGRARRHRSGVRGPTHREDGRSEAAMLPLFGAV